MHGRTCGVMYKLIYELTRNSVLMPSMPSSVLKRISVKFTPIPVSLSLKSFIACIYVYGQSSHKTTPVVEE